MGFGMRVAVVVFWLAMMLWLVAEKVVPPLLVGAPPSYKNIVGRKKMTDCWGCSGYLSWYMVLDNNGICVICGRDILNEQTK